MDRTALHKQISHIHKYRRHIVIFIALKLYHPIHHSRITLFHLRAVPLLFARHSRALLLMLLTLLAPQINPQSSCLSHSRLRAIFICSTKPRMSASHVRRGWRWGCNAMRGVSSVRGLCSSAALLIVYRSTTASQCGFGGSRSSSIKICFREKRIQSLSWVRVVCGNFRHLSGLFWCSSDRSATSPRNCDTFGGYI